MTMTITLDDVEYAAWHFGSYPIQEYMDELLDTVQRYADGAAPPPPDPGPDVPLKACSRCHAVKPVTAFNKDRHAKDGLRYQCRDCESDMRKRLRSAAAQRRTDKYGARATHRSSGD